jgi:hypothetical protein
MTKFIASLIARKKLLLLIGLWLAAVTTAGYFIGASDNKQKLSNTIIYNNTNIRPGSRKVFLDYTCNGTKVASYDIGEGHVLTDLRESVFVPKESLFQKVYIYAIGALGSGTAHAIASVKSVPKSFGRSKRERARHFFLASLYAASGFYTGVVGYQIGSQRPPGCEDPEIFEGIRNDAFWKPVVKSVAKDLWRQAARRTDRNEIAADQSPVLENALIQIENNKADLNLFLVLLDELGGKYRKGEDRPPAPWTLAHFSIFTVAMIVVTMMLAYFYLSVSEASGSPKKSRKPRRELND